MKKITVQTLPNGYALNFDGDRRNGYMYFNVDDLLKGFMIHIGLNMTEQLSMENIDDFLVAVMNWNETGKCINELRRMEEELTLAQTSRNRIARQMIDEREKHLELVNNIKALIRKLESYPDKDIAESLRKLILSRKAMKAITMSGLGINVKDEEL
jgi:hypothetical protein